MAYHVSESVRCLGVGRSWVLLLCVAAACGGGGGDKPSDDAGKDGSSADGAVDGAVNTDGSVIHIDGGPDGGLVLPPELGPVTGDAEFTSMTNETSASGVTCTDVTYDSDGLSIVGRMCRPTDGTDLPILIYNDELQRYADSTGDVKAYAALGFAVFQSAYRGVGGSDGTIELCKGEVYDVRRMLQIAKTQSFVDNDRIAMLGFSHGGCISMKVLLGEMLEQTTTFDAVADVYGPSDIAAALVGQRAFFGQTICLIPIPACLQALEALDTLEMAYVDVPGDRRTIQYAGLLAQTTTPLLIVHATGDTAVPYKQNCDLASGIGDFDAWHANLFNGGNTGSAPEACGGPGITWKAGDIPTSTYASERTLVIYETVSPTGHTRTAGAGLPLGARARAFLADKMGLTL